MSIAARMIETLQATPALAGVLIRYSYIPQDDEKKPPSLPYMVLRRSGTEYVETTCGVYPNGNFVNLELLTVAKNVDDACDLALTARFALEASADQPSIESESDDYDPQSRGHVVSQLYRVWDDAPSVD